MAKASFKPDFEEIAVRCSGMLAPAVYQRIYETARRSPGGLLVEVGTAKGAATVALALGLRNSGKPGRVISFDRGRQRNGKGDPQHYFEGVMGNLRYFGVEDLVDLVVGEVSKETVRAVPESAPISVLMLDADGAIDRDLGVFLDRIVPGGAVIIDDSADLVKLDRVGFSTVRIDAKMRLTFLLLSYFKDKGVLSEGTQIKDTYFGEKLRGLPDDADTGEILEIYRQLTFASAKHSPLQTARVLAIRTLKIISPSFTQRLRVRHRRRISADRMIQT